MYTNKDVVKVVVFTNTYRLEGHLHLMAGSRLTDALNVKAKDFLAVTEVRVFDLSDNRMLYEAPYVAVNRDSISCVIPLEPENLSASTIPRPGGHGLTGVIPVEPENLSAS